MAEVKVCGLTRPDDARAAVALGAAYVGVIFAGGPRMLEPAAARAVLDPVPPRIRRVGVFGAGTAEAIGARAREAGVAIIQLHADPDTNTVRAVRACFAGPVWAVIRVVGSVLPANAPELFAEADAVVLDARAETGLGGTGIALPWRELAAPLSAVRQGGRLIVAGGLTPANVAAAIEALAPDVVDVSSGVETAPGVKNQSLMSAFITAAHSSTRAA